MYITENYEKGKVHIHPYLEKGHGFWGYRQPRLSTISFNPLSKKKKTDVLLHRETEKALYSVIVAPKDTREDHATFDCRPEVEYLDFQKVDPPQDNSPSNISSQESLSREYQTQEPSNINILRKFVESKKTIIQDQDAKNEFVKNRLDEFYKLAQSIYESIGPWAADWYISKVFEKLKGSGNNFNPYCRVREEDKDHLVKTMQSLPFVDISYDPESIEKGLSKKASCLCEKQYTNLHHISNTLRKNNSMTGSRE